MAQPIANLVTFIATHCVSLAIPLGLAGGLIVVVGWPCIDWLVGALTVMRVGMANYGEAR